ncbi:MAG: DUF1553 domain-containing protein [Planctomycetes bacterium]|nr:DUF1553 domain-containing protein [Planctomycetota bacterium]
MSRRRIGWSALLLAVLAATIAAGRGPARFARIEAFPARIELADPFAYVQVVLTGVRADGGRVDVTRDAELVGGGDLVALDARGLARPRRDGAGELRFRVDELEISIPVTVRDSAAAFAPGFLRDVQPVLTRQGCNAGTCHGAAQGKNGFQLSLRGYDPLADHAALTDELAGRRFDRAEPAQSLFLLKPTGAVPHQGGKVLDPAEPDYALLEAWVAGGARLDADAARVASIELFPEDPTLAEPGQAQQFAVWATYEDGSTRDVTAHAFVESGNTEVVEVGEGGLVRTLRRGEAAILARYAGRYAATRLFVMGDRDGFVWQPQPAQSYVDALIDARLEEVRALPSGPCTDEEFLRRVHLDLTGLPPNPRDVTTFTLDARASDVKRAEVIDRLIGSPAFVDHWTNRWCDLLQVNRKFLGQPGARALREWIRGALAGNLPYDAFVRALMTGTGSTLANPPAAFFKIHREPDAAMEAVTQLFLGVRFNCNKCHDHPFERWTQRQHWELAALFADVERHDVDGAERMPRSTVMEGRQPPTVEERIADGSGGVVQDPNGREYGPHFPYEPAGVVPADGSRRERLAAWLTAPENPYFARSYVNRVWSYLLGRGLIEPVDDLRAGNPPSHPELLDRLTDEFVRSGFDVRALIRRICNTRAYQRSVEANAWNADDDVHFAKAIARRLPAEVLYDALHQAAGVRPRLPGTRPGTRARDLVDPEVEAPDGFLGLFGRPPRESVCECERSDGVSLGQALNLVNGTTFGEVLDAPDNAIAELVEYERDAGRVLEELYLRFLCRRPTAEERATLLPALDPLVADNAAALPGPQLAELAARRRAWETAQAPALWHTVAPGNVRSAAGAPLEVLDDGSVRAGGNAADTDVYEFVGRTDLARLSGIRLELLPDPSFPRGGPGRADSGNFVLAHVTASVVPLADVTGARPVALAAATADFSQRDWPVASAIVDDDKGWGIHPNAGTAHEAVFELAEDVGADGGALVLLRLRMPYGGRHVIGRFRVSVTDAPRPVRYSDLPTEVTAALRVPEDERDDMQRAAVHRAFVPRDPELLQWIRLATAQDLAWALATSPAFLFNR